MIGLKGCAGCEKSKRSIELMDLRLMERDENCRLPSAECRHWGRSDKDLSQLVALCDPSIRGIQPFDKPAVESVLYACARVRFLFQLNDLKAWLFAKRSSIGTRGVQYSEPDFAGKDVENRSERARVAIVRRRSLTEPMRSEAI